MARFDSDAAKSAVSLMNCVPSNSYFSFQKNISIATVVTGFKENHNRDLSSGLQTKDIRTTVVTDQSIPAAKDPVEYLSNRLAKVNNIGRDLDNPFVSSQFVKEVTVKFPGDIFDEVKKMQFYGLAKDAIYQAVGKENVLSCMQFENKGFEHRDEMVIRFTPLEKREGFHPLGKSLQYSDRLADLQAADIVREAEKGLMTKSQQEKLNQHIAIVVDKAVYNTENQVDHFRYPEMFIKECKEELSKIINKEITDMYSRDYDGYHVDNIKFIPRDDITSISR